MSSTPEQDTPDAAAPVVDPVDENLAIIARQAIVDESRAVYGYELFDRSTASDSHTAASDAALLFNALSYAGTEALVGKKTVFINCTHDSLSGGQKKLLELCRALIGKPKLLFLDEPSAGMTHEETQQLMDEIVRMETGEAKPAIVLIEHEMNVIRRITSRCIVLNFGEKLCEGSYEKVTADPMVQEAYLGTEVCEDEQV